MVDTIVELTGVSREVAEQALLTHKEVWLAVDSLLERPPVEGDKYLPKKRRVDTGLSEEQEARCKKGRWLQDQVNAVFSVAHSKTRTQPGQLAHEAQQVPSDENPPSVSVPAASEQQQQDGLVQTSLPTRQSEELP